jgi:hypothetical protein
VPKYAPTGVSPIAYKYIFYRILVKAMKEGEMMREKMGKKRKKG